MKEPLEIRAINIKNRIKAPHMRVTLSIFTQDNREKIKNILDKCNDHGFMKVEKDGKLKEFFQVEQILYRGQWDRFEGHGGEPTAFNSYIMPFEQFIEKGRPKKIYIDFYNSVSLKE